MPTLPASTYSAALTAEDGSQRFLAALESAGVADEDFAELLAGTTATAIQLSELNGLSLLPSQGDASSHPTSVPTDAGISAGALVPAVLLSVALTEGGEMSHTGPSVTVNASTQAQETTVRFEAVFADDSGMDATLRQAICPTNGEARGSFQASASFGEVDWERRGVFVATVSEGRITAMKTSIRSQIEMSDSSTESAATINGTLRATLDGASGGYSLRSSLKSRDLDQTGRLVDGRLVDAELDMAASNMALMGSVLEDHWRNGLCG